MTIFLRLRVKIDKRCSDIIYINSCMIVLYIIIYRVGLEEIGSPLIMLVRSDQHDQSWQTGAGDSFYARMSITLITQNL